MKIIEGYKYPIAKYANKIELDIILLKFIQAIAKKYGGRIKISEEIQDECLEILTSEFKHLGIEEIQDAFRLYALQKFDIRGGEMYAGQFNALILSRVLTGYESYRKKILEEYLKSKSDREYQEKQEQKRQQEIIEFNNNFDTILNKILQKAETWEDIPVWLYQSCYDRGLINFCDGEAQSIFEEAKLIAKKAIKKEKKLATDRNEFKRLDRILKNEDEDYELKAKIIARKISVFRNFKTL